MEISKKTMNSLLYFAYGSNMSTPRLRARTPSAKRVCTARLQGHRLVFHKKGRDGSGKCDIFHTGETGAVVHGVVFRVLLSDKPFLDRHEGLGSGYETKPVSLTDETGEPLSALTYFATDIDAGLNPYHWYKDHVLRGAIEHNLPHDYIRIIQSVVSIPDPDPENHRKELSVYQTCRS